MRLRRAIAGALLLIAFASCAQAQTRRPMLTGKERLGPKWTDEQRIDNCNVPIDKRGTKPRPGGCANRPSS
jgi:ribosomal protein L27